MGHIRCEHHPQCTMREKREKKGKKGKKGKKREKISHCISQCIYDANIIPNVRWGKKGKKYRIVLANAYTMRTSSPMYDAKKRGNKGEKRENKKKKGKKGEKRGKKGKKRGKREKK